MVAGHVDSPLAVQRANPSRLERHRCATGGTDQGNMQNIHLKVIVVIKII
jgi:hypothetical protein